MNKTDKVSNYKIAPVFFFFPAVPLITGPGHMESMSRENEPRVAKSRTPAELAVAAAHQLCGRITERWQEPTPPFCSPPTGRRFKKRLLPRARLSLTSADSVHHRRAEPAYLKSQAVGRVGDLHRPGGGRAADGRGEGEDEDFGRAQRGETAGRTLWAWCSRAPSGVPWRWCTA